MRYVSLFSGVEAATVAWSRLGWEPLAFAEVDEFPAAVLACRFPDVPNLGDVCGIDWEEFHERHGAVDVLIGGSPCQSFSIAGGRAGLQGESRLMFEYIRAVRDLVRASGGGSPRYIIWENVPGCLSSNKGRDFGCLLDELEECGYFVAWRTLDSQFARVFDRAGGGFRGPVPQRRRRVFLVGSLGGPSAADILFERSCLRGDHPKGREAREALAEDAPGGAGVGDCAGFKYHQGSGVGSIGYGDVSPTIATDYHSPAVHYGFCQGASTSASGIGWSEECAPMIKGGESGTAQVPTVLAVRTANTGANGCGVAEEVTHTLDGANGQCVAIDYKQTPKVSEDVSHTITHEGSGGIHSAVAFVGEFGGNTGCAVTEDLSPAITAKRAPSVMTQYGDVAGTLRARGDSSPCADSGQNVLCMGSQQGRAAVYENLSPTVTSAAGTSGNNQPVVCMESAQARAAVEVDLSPTLNASHEQPIVCAADDNGKAAIE